MKKRCYYQILEVDKKATVTDIKQSYRKLALKYHPDKNNEEESKQMFIQVQEAYQVLSDPNERTWYDNNREKILFDKDSMTKEDLEMHTFGFNIWEFFTPSCYKGYEDVDEKNFYKVYRQVFERIKQSERQAYQYDGENEQEFRKFEGFGDPKTSIDKVLKFYEDWDNMTTYKSFVWKQQWDTKEAPNRWVRRQMEKQNKKERQKQRKFYIKTVKDLISYLRKRDPRYQAHLMELNQKQKKREEEKKIRLQQQKKMKQQQKQLRKQLQEQRLREVQQYYQNQGEVNSQEENKNTKLDRSHEEEFYCQICDKGFKSENQLNNHHNSKMHKQNVKLLMSEVVLDSDKKEMQKQIIKTYQPVVKDAKKTQPKQENQKGEIQQNAKQNQQKKKKKNKKKKQYQLSSQDEELVVPPQNVQRPQKQPVKKQQSQSQSDDDDFVNAMLKNRGKNTKPNVVTKKPFSDSDDQKTNKKKKKQTKKPGAPKQQNEQEEDQVPEKTLGKAKLKKLKKQERQTEQKDKVRCMVCKQVFTSKTKLFSHINETGHAAAKR